MNKAPSRTSIETIRAEDTIEMRLRHLAVIERDILPVVEERWRTNAVPYLLEMVERYAGREEDALHLLAFAAKKGQNELFNTSKKLERFYNDKQLFLANDQFTGSNKGGAQIGFWFFEQHARIAGKPDYKPGN